MSNELSLLKEQLEGIQSVAQAKLQEVAAIEQRMNAREREIQLVAENIDKKLSGMIEKDEFLQFFEQPYVVIPQGKSKMLVAVPKFVSGFQVGWLWKETDSFYIYQFDQYSAWLGDAPKELLEQIAFKKEFEATVEGDVIKYEPSQKDVIKKKLGDHLKDITETEARILQGHAFDLIADMVEGGCLPFKAKPVNKQDLRQIGRAHV